MAQIKISFFPLSPLFCIYNRKEIFMPYSKISIHVVWATKNRKPFLNKKIRPIIQDHIWSNAITKGIYIDIINGHVDHMHCLLSLSNDQRLSDVVRLLKGESSFWINQQQLVPGKFGWQDEFYAISVCESSHNRVYRYIRNQDQHHRKKKFQKEYEEFIRVVGIRKPSTS